LETLSILFRESGFQGLMWSNLVMFAVGGLLIYLAIRKNYEPLLLIPIGFGAFLANLPGTLLAVSDSYVPAVGGSAPPLLQLVYDAGIRTEFLPPVIFLGVGALTWGGAAAPTTIYLTSILAPHLLGPVAVAAYSYMSLVPILQPPVLRLLTTRAERAIDMPQAKPVSQAAVIAFPIATAAVAALAVPSCGPLVGMLMFGNLLRESGVTERLSRAAGGTVIDVATIFLGITIGATMDGPSFLRPQTLAILVLGAVAFAFSTAGGVVLAKALNLVLPRSRRLNPCIGAAGVSAVPMASRVVQDFVSGETNGRVNPLMAAMGPNVAGVIGTAVAAGVFLALLR
jgi:Na+-transporting methylmalonyl-CoA/oxaloacetate decarboxylase beta subunit